MKNCYGNMANKPRKLENRVEKFQNHFCKNSKCEKHIEKTLTPISTAIQHSEKTLMTKIMSKTAVHVYHSD